LGRPEGLFLTNNIYFAPKLGIAKGLGTDDGVVLVGGVIIVLFDVLWGIFWGIFGGFLIFL
jgi:hypothetical protein